MINSVNLNPIFNFCKNHSFLVAGGGLVALVALYMWKGPPSNPPKNLASNAIEPEPISPQLEAEAPKGTVLWQIRNSSEDTWNYADVHFQYQDNYGKRTSSIEFRIVTKPTETLIVYTSDLGREFQTTDVKICKIVYLFFKTEQGLTVNVELKEALVSDLDDPKKIYCSIAATKASDDYKAKHGFVQFRGELLRMG